MRLEIGSRAPIFTAQALGGDEVDLASLRGRAILLKFYRFAACSLSNMHMRRFIKEYKELEDVGLTTVVLYHSPVEKLEEMNGKLPPFALIGDLDKRIFRAYGVENGLAGMFSPAVIRAYRRALKAGYPPGIFSDSDGGVAGNPADFVIDENGRIAFARYGRHYADSLDAGQIAGVLQALQNKRIQSGVNLKHPSAVRLKNALFVAARANDVSAWT